MPFFLSAIGLFALIQFTLVFFYQHRLYKFLSEELRRGGTTETFAFDWGPISLFSLANTSPFYIGSFLLIFTTIIGYSLFIWYRDWFGKHLFIYRLLLMPVHRMTIYSAKFSAIVVMLLALVASQLVFIPLQAQLLTMNLPNQLVEPSSLSLLYSANWLFGPEFSMGVQASLTISLLVLLLFSLFLIVLLERSFRLKGIFIAIAYLATVSGISIALLLFLNRFLYLSELFVVTLILCLLFSALAIVLAFYLLAKKITV